MNSISSNVLSDPRISRRGIFLVDVVVFNNFKSNKTEGGEEAYAYETLLQI